jgi:HK97 gp10 family phage protein
MDYSVRIDGLDKIKESLAATPKRIEQGVNKALYAAAKHVETVAKKSILSGGKSGIVYHRRSVTHRASAPGEAPASDTGRLVNSISSYAGDGESFVTAGRGTVKYASMLEFGTSKMAPRPFMFPALEQSKAWIKERLALAIARATGK